MATGRPECYTKEVLSAEENIYSVVVNSCTSGFPPSQTSKFKGLVNDGIQMKASFSEDGMFVISGSEDGQVMPPPPPSPPPLLLVLLLHPIVLYRYKAYMYVPVLV